MGRDASHPDRSAPHSVEAEQAVLGSILLDSAHAWPQVVDVLRARDFYRPDHRVIFAALEELGRQHKNADPVIVAELLERRGELAGAGALAYLGTLARDTPSAANVGHYAQVVRERSTLRALQAFGDSIDRRISERGDRGVEQLVADVQGELLEVQSRATHGKGLISSRDLAADLVDDLDARREKSRGLPIGLDDFDELTGGLEAGDLVVFAARPGMGKTALLVSIAARVAPENSVAVFSAEMPSRQLMRRAVALLGGISQRALRRPERLEDADWAAISRGAGEVARLRLSVDDSALPTLAHVRAECMALKARDGLALVLVDYVQLVQGTGRNRYEELREVAYGLKALAKDLALPVIVLAQLNRSVEAREHKRPHLSDLRDSGAIEEAADIVALLFSEGYYDRQFGMGYVLEANIEKHRNGERGQCLWHFAGDRSAVTVLDEGARVQYRRLLAERARSKHGAPSDDL